MAENDPLTTGNTSGMTGLSAQAIQRYIRRYPMGFSDLARKPNKGRRYTGNDVKNLLLINYLLNTKQKSHIEKALAGEEEYPLFEIQGFISMFIKLDYMLRITDALMTRLAKERRLAYEWKHDAFLGSMGKAINSHADAIDALRFDVNRLQLVRKLNEDKHPIIDPKMETKRKGLVERWLDAMDG